MKRSLKVIIGLMIGGISALVALRVLDGLSPVDKAAIHAELSLSLDELHQRGQRPLRISQLEP